MSITLTLPIDALIQTMESDWNFVYLLDSENLRIFLNLETIPDFVRLLIINSLLLNGNLENKDLQIFQNQQHELQEDYDPSFVIPDMYRLKNSDLTSQDVYWILQVIIGNSKDLWGNYLLSDRFSHFSDYNLDNLIYNVFTADEKYLPETVDNIVYFADVSPTTAKYVNWILHTYDPTYWIKNQIYSRVNPFAKRILTSNEMISQLPSGLKRHWPETLRELAYRQVKDPRKYDPLIHELHLNF